MGQCKRPQNSHLDFHPAPSSTPQRRCLTRVPSPRLSSKTCTCFSWPLRDRQAHSLLSSEHQISPDCLGDLVTPPGMLSGWGSPLPVLHPLRGHILVSAHIPLPGYMACPRPLNLLGRFGAHGTPWVCVREQHRRLTGPAPSALGVSGGPSSRPPNASCLTASQRMSLISKCKLTFHPQAHLPPAPFPMSTLLGKGNRLLAFTVSRALEMPQACPELLLCGTCSHF
uniref:Uncharacterized protein n=1 Tax=Nomascus leucogenys TaxID=61853 RepID=A0A2I3H3S4_NOMLE